MSATVIPKKLLLTIWLSLMGLLFLTWLLAQFNLRALNLVAALTIAIAKMALVILFFMHVKYKPPLNWLFVAAGFIWLVIMIDLTLSDYLTRGQAIHESVPPGTHEVVPSAPGGGTRPTGRAYFPKT